MNFRATFPFNKILKILGLASTILSILQKFFGNKDKGDK